jgi:putative pyrimidine permease RutG
VFPARHTFPSSTPTAHTRSRTRTPFSPLDPVADGVTGPEERLPWGQTLVVGLQHVFAMFGATGAGAQLHGFDPNTSVH